MLEQCVNPIIFFIILTHILNIFDCIRYVIIKVTVSTMWKAIEMLFHYLCLLLLLLLLVLF